jgi:hypothetical protein
MGYTVEEQMWVKNDLDALDKLPKRIRDAIRNHSRKIDVRELKRIAATDNAMLELIRTGKAPI